MWKSPSQDVSVSNWIPGSVLHCPLPARCTRSSAVPTTGAGVCISALFTLTLTVSCAWSNGPLLDRAQQTVARSQDGACSLEPPPSPYKDYTPTSIGAQDQWAPCSEDPNHTPADWEGPHPQDSELWDPVIAVFTPWALGLFVTRCYCVNSWWCTQTLILLHGATPASAQIYKPRWVWGHF